MRLRDGQSATIGRSEWADFAFPRDAAMTDVHAELRCRSTGCEISDRTDGKPGLTVNGQPVATGPLADGDELLVGSTRLTVTVSGSADTAAHDGLHVVTARERFGSLELTSPALGLLGDQAADAYLTQLTDAGLYGDAVRVLAYSVPRPAAVRWAVECTRSIGAVRDDDPVLAMADEWAAEPSETHRRAAEAAADEATGPRKWIALAVFWSGGSIAPADAPGDVPPDDRLTSTAIAGALQLLAAESVNGPSSCLKRFIEMGRRRQPVDAEAGH